MSETANKLFEIRAYKFRIKDQRQTYRTRNVCICLYVLRYVGCKEKETCTSNVFGKRNTSRRHRHSLFTTWRKICTLAKAFYYATTNTIFFFLLFFFSDERRWGRHCSLILDASIGAQNTLAIRNFLNRWRTRYENRKIYEDIFPIDWFFL